MSEDDVPVVALLRGDRLVRMEVRSRVLLEAGGGALLHAYMRAADFPEGREDVSSVGEALQLSTICAPAGQSWPPHAHIDKTITSRCPAQETWIVVAGSVEVTYYDLDDSEIGRVILGVGDCSITWRGGHGYRALEEGARVYEVKSGPYLGHRADKRLLQGL